MFQRTKFYLTVNTVDQTRLLFFNKMKNFTFDWFLESSKIILVFTHNVNGQVYHATTAAGEKMLLHTYRSCVILEENKLKATI